MHHIGILIANSFIAFFFQLIPLTQTQSLMAVAKGLTGGPQAPGNGHFTPLVWVIVWGGR